MKDSFNMKMWEKRRMCRVKNQLIDVGFFAIGFLQWGREKKLRFHFSAECVLVVVADGVLVKY